MKISELIKLLETRKKQFGNIITNNMKIMK